jgi:TfoX/Sxy family transcriptional regulator of competence genes
MIIGPDIFMPYNEKLADRIRIAIAHLPKLEEKKMFRGLTFMVNGKMCIAVSAEEMMCRIDPSIHDEVAEKNGCRPMVMKGKGYKGFVYVSQEGFKSKKDFDYWINLCLDFNGRAKAAKKKKK